MPPFHVLKDFVMAKRKTLNKDAPKKDTKFKPGDKAALKWTEETVLEVLQKMWDTVATDEDGEKPNNPVRANDIKTLAEVCLINKIGKQRISEWEKQFKDSAPISELLKNIKWVIETRMIYSGQTMDIFVLKNHYGYADKQEVDHTTKGESIRENKIDYSKLSATALKELSDALGPDG